jgi:rod shape-determining protein MreD
MTLTLAAVGSVVAALIELSIGPFLEIGGGRPHFVFVFAVVWTVVAGFDGGLVWAFVGGLALDLLAPRPLGSTAFALLLMVGAAAIIARFVNQMRLRFLAPIIVVAALSPAYSLLVLVIYGALTGPLHVGNPLGPLVPGIVLDLGLAAVLGPLGLALKGRFTEQERLDW